MQPLSRRTVLFLTVATSLSASLTVRGGQAQESAIFVGPMVGAPMQGSFQAGEPQPTGTGVVSGVVVSADFKRPVRRATVRLSSTTPRMPRTVTTDDRGRFSFEQVAPGDYTVSTSKPGYLESIYGQKVPGSGRAGTPISIADGDRKEDLTVAIGRGGVLAGVIVDDGGEPAYGATVQALRASWQGGERTFREAGRSRTDDRGAYRIGALPPGEYVVVASPASAFERPDVFGPMAGVVRGPEPEQSQGYAPVYYPGTTSPASATRLTLAVSEEKAAIDLQLLLVPMGRVEGIVSTGGDPSAGTTVQLIDLDESLPGFSSRLTSTGPTGQFVFTNVPPGRYRLQARTGPARAISVDPSSEGTRVMMRFEAAAPARALGGVFMEPPSESLETLWASTEISLTGEERQTVSLFLEPGVSVSGRLRFDDSSAPPQDLSILRIILNSATSANGLSSGMTAIEQDGSFTLAGVVPGSYRVVVLSPTAWRPKSFDVDGRDALDFLLHVERGSDIADAVLTLTTSGASLSGTLQSATGQPTADYSIILFADDERYWTPQSRRIQATRPATDGRYAFRNLPAGTYRLVAVDDLEEGRWFDPEVLRTLASSALRVAVGDRETRQQDIRLAR
jgi:protocatechuate 3,4-dioxygenase beta subunit